MQHSGFLRLVLAVAVLGFAAGCSDDSTTPTTPTPPTTVTETFSGTVGRNSVALHSFSTGSSGTLTATLTALGPESTALVGMSLGTWNGSACAVVIDKVDATQNTILTGAVSANGFLCVRIYDVGNITAAEPFSYEIVVVHP